MTAFYKASIAGAAGYRSQRHSEHGRLGQARKRAQVAAAGGIYQHGRRPTGTAVGARVRELAGQGLGRRQIAQPAGELVGTVPNYLAGAATATR